VIEAVDIGLDARWEQRLGLQPGELDRHMEPVWRAGSLGECTEEDVHQEMGKRLDMNQEQIEEYMREMWDWYCGRLNVPMADFFRSLRPHYQTAILSNSFVGARREEQQPYHFEEMCDLIIYTHEEGIAKPDPRIYELTCKRLVGHLPTAVGMLQAKMMLSKPTRSRTAQYNNAERRKSAPPNIGPAIKPRLPAIQDKPI
jgi:FMN phosphatase YigB (HAD superfamily)